MTTIGAELNQTVAAVVQVFVCSREEKVLCIFCQAFRWAQKTESQVGAVNAHLMILHIMNPRVRQGWVMIFDTFSQTSP